MNFIDTHQHLIYRARFGYGWTNDIPALACGDFTRRDYSSLTRDAGIGGTIFMESGVDDADYKAEARCIAGRVGRHGLLGQIASCRPEDDRDFDPWLEECTELNVVGFRRILHVMPDDLSRSDMFRANLRKIGRAGLPFDLCLLARQLPIGAELAAACDRTVMVLDHCGVPDIAGGGFEEWSTGVKALSALPNVKVKLSGITAYCAPGTANLETLEPWVNHIIECFGPDRIVWGGDWPVVNLGSGLPEWIRLTRRLISGLSADEQSLIAAGNARAIYRLS